MKGFGWGLLVIGIIATFVAFNIDVSVSTGYGNRVNNIGLMSDRQNYILISCFIILCGLLMIIFGSRKSISSDTVKCPYCAELINKEAIKCKHCGSNVERKLIPNNTDKPTYHFVYLDNNNTKLDDNEVKRFADYLVSKLPLGADVFTSFNDEISKMMESLPNNIRGDFMKKMHHFVYDK